MKPELEDPTVEALYTAHYADVLAYCARRVGRSDADDAASEVFMVAWQRRNEIDWAMTRGGCGSSVVPARSLPMHLPPRMSWSCDEQRTKEYSLRSRSSETSTARC